MAQKETLLTWLNDAFAMEEGLVETLERQAAHAKENPEVATKIQEHVEQTKKHAELVKASIERLGGSVSTVKSALGNVMGVMQGMSTAATNDTLIKDALSSYAAEHFEIASYKAIKEAANMMEDSETVAMCESIIKEEQAMATWLDDQLPKTVQQFLQQEQDGTA